MVHHPTTEKVVEFIAIKVIASFFQ